MPQLLAQLSPLLDRCEVVLVDGGSTDETRALIPDCFRVIEAPRGRGSQLNAGAEASVGDVLFFLHVDSVLPSDPLREIERVIKRHRAGCFGVSFRPSSPVLLLCQVMSQLRCAVRGIAYGDQGIFVRRDLFEEVSGFPPLPFMEDLEFSYALRACGVRFGMARRRIVTSSRRFGPSWSSQARTWALMARLRRLYRSGVPIDKLAEIYGDAR